MSKRSKDEYADRRQPTNPIWSIERALRHGYVMQPHRPTMAFTLHPKDHCAVRTAAIHSNLDNNNPLPEACETQCAECAHICHMNDYIRGKLPAHYALPAIRYELRVEEDFFGYGAVVFVRHEEERMWFEHCIYATDEQHHEPETLSPNDPEYYMQYT